MLVARRGLQDGEEGEGGEVDCGDVDVEDGGPRRRGLGIPEGGGDSGGRGGGWDAGFGAGDPGGAEEEVEVVFVRGEGGHQGGEGGFRGYVAGSEAGRSPLVELVT